MDYNNPFEYASAFKLGADKIVDFYVPDYNYSRFIRSRRNIFLVGERGCGKSMTLLYNSVPIQQNKAEKEGAELKLDILCVHIPCNTPLMYRREYQLLNDFQASIISEHFLVLKIMFDIADSLSKIPNLTKGMDESDLREELGFLLPIELPSRKPVLEGLAICFQKAINDAEKVINAKEPDVFYENTLSFSSGVLSLLTCLREILKLADSHFALMLDDAQVLNKHQIKVLNSWIAYRDNSLFSFKIATTKVDRPPLHTASGGEIFEGHDFTSIDMEQPYQNRLSDFGKLARDIIHLRLKKIGISISKTPEEFFPVNPTFAKDIKECEDSVREEARKKFINGTQKQITDYVYKYTRAKYFRDRSKRANLPPYSGFETLVHLSTGVIRNLLEPPYWMYDKMISGKHSKGEKHPIIEEIPYSVQTEIILDRSVKKWALITKGLDDTIEKCSREEAKQLENLFENLAILFKTRLLKHKSEPRAISFTISDTRLRLYPELAKLLILAQKAMLLYTYTSSAKDLGRRETYYVPNRMLCPVRGLDPIGQHARVSIKAIHLWAAATENKKIPFSQATNTKERGLFDDEQ